MNCDVRKTSGSRSLRCVPCMRLRPQTVDGVLPLTSTAASFSITSHFKFSLKIP